MSTINVLTLPEYYYLYALFFDYPLNNAFAIDREERDRIRSWLRQARPAAALYKPYEKSFTLRLFTERSALARWSPELSVEILRQLKHAVDRLRGAFERRYPRLHRHLVRRADALAARAPVTEPDEDRSAVWPQAGDPPPPIRYLLTA
jgi:hypothetical protein